MARWYRATSDTTQLYVDIDLAPSMWVGGASSTWYINAQLVSSEDVQLTGTYASQAEAMDKLAEIVGGVDLGA